MTITDASCLPMTFGDRDVILFIRSGQGTVRICGRDFSVQPTDGIYVRPAEAFCFTAAAGSRLEVFACARPPGAMQWLERMPQKFAADFPERVVSCDRARQLTMGPRYFQRLIDKAVGSQVITQFIGHIPRSKAAPHRHLYEESLLILSGEGCLWTEDRKANVRAGEVIFLPRKQLHSLQATCSEGMDVVGVICPEDNPSISY